MMMHTNANSMDGGTRIRNIVAPRVSTQERESHAASLILLQGGGYVERGRVLATISDLGGCEAGIV